MEADSNVTSEVSQPRRFRLRAFLLLAAAMAAAGVVSAKVVMDQAQNRVLARTDQVTLHESDLKDLLATFDAATRERLLEDTAALTTLLRRELGRRLLERRAFEEKWDQREEVQARLERLRLDLITTSYLEAQSAPPATFPSDAEIETAYQLNQQRFLMPRQFHLAQVYVRRPDDTAQVEASRRSAQALADELRKQPGRFAEVARRKSDDVASAPKGGDLGWLPEDQIQPAIRAVAIGLGKGEVSEAIEAADGWHILRMVETKPAAVAPLEQVRDRLVAMLRQQRAQENAAAFVSRLMTEKQAVVDEITLAQTQKDLR